MPSMNYFRIVAKERYSQLACRSHPGSPRVWSNVVLAESTRGQYLSFYVFPFFAAVSAAMGAGGYGNESSPSFQVRHDA